MIAAESKRAVRVNRPALTAVAATATVIGTAPYALFLGRPWLALIFAAAAAVIAWGVVGKLTTASTWPPRPLEFLVAGLGALRIPATAAWLGMVFYGLIRFLTWLLDLLVSMLWDRFHPDPATWAFWGSLAMALWMTAGSIADMARDYSRQLYPQTAGLRSAFYPVVTFQRKTLLWGAAATFGLILVGVLLVAVFPVIAGKWWVEVLLAVGLAMLATPFAGAGEEQTPEGPEAMTAAMAQLFMAGGYQVAIEPRTEEESIDPLLVNTVDFYAEKDHRGMVVKILEAEAAQVSSEISRIPDLSSAAWALQKFFASDPETPETTVTPVVVLAGSARAPEVRIYEKKGFARVLRITDDALMDSFLAAEPATETGERVFPEELQAAARSILLPLEETSGRGLRSESRETLA